MRSPPRRHRFDEHRPLPIGEPDSIRLQVANFVYTGTCLRRDAESPPSGSEKSVSPAPEAMMGTVYYSVSTLFLEFLRASPADCHHGSHVTIRNNWTPLIHKAVSHDIR